MNMIQKFTMIIDQIIISIEVNGWYEYTIFKNNCRTTHVAAIPQNWCICFDYLSIALASSSIRQF